MRISCNGCRVLRKGCSDSCTIRPCLEWIKSPDSQANATVFLAKFYGRAGLVNLINAGPEEFRPAIFRSLLYEACGRTINPIYGSVGMLWSASWHLCHAAVEAVLLGAQIGQAPSEVAAAAVTQSPPPRARDIRHVGKDKEPEGAAASSALELHRVNKKARARFKRSGGTRGEFGRGRSRESEAEGSLASAETADALHVSQGAEPGPADRLEGEVELELSLGPQPPRPRAEPERRVDGSDGLGLELSK